MEWLVRNDSGSCECPVEPPALPPSQSAPGWLEQEPACQRHPPRCPACRARLPLSGRPAQLFPVATGPQVWTGRQATDRGAGTAWCPEQRPQERAQRRAQEGDGPQQHVWFARLCPPELHPQHKPQGRRGSGTPAARPYNRLLPAFLLGGLHPATSSLRDWRVRLLVSRRSGVCYPGKLPAHPSLPSVALQKVTGDPMDALTLKRWFERRPPANIHILLLSG